MRSRITPLLLLLLPALAALPAAPAQQSNLEILDSGRQSGVIETPAPTVPPPGAAGIDEPSPGRWAEPALWRLLEARKLNQLQREIERLQAEDPGWQPPAELLGWLDRARRDRGEAQLWQHLESGEADALARGIASLRTRHPDWQPPAEMTGWLEQHRRRQGIAATAREITASARRQDWDRLLELARRNPGQFDCRRVDHLWWLAEARLARGDTAGAEGVYRRIIDRCASFERRLDSLSRAAAQLPPEAVDTLLARERTRRHSSAQQARLEDLRYRWAQQRAGAALAAERFSEAGQRLSPWEQEIHKRQDAGAARLLGWARLNDGRPRAAARWFGTALDWQPEAEAARGRLLALAALEDRETLLEEARRYRQRYPQTAPLAEELLLARAADHLQRGEHEHSLALLAELPASLQARRLRGWNLHGLGRHRPAADLFETAYRETGQRQDAEALAVTLQAAGAEDRLAVLADEQGGALGDVWRLTRAEALYSRRRFLGAAHQAPEAFPQLAGLAAGGAALGAALRHRPGDDGRDRLELTRLPQLSIGKSHGPWRWNLQLDRVELEAGRPREGDPLGSFPGPEATFAASPDTGMAGLAAQLSVAREGLVTPYAALGLGPDGVLEGQVHGRLGLEGHRGRVNFRLEAFREPVVASLLAYTGLRDPYGEQTWGRVTANGLQGNLSGEPVPGWSLDLSLRGAEYRGERVADNRGLGARLSLSRELPVEGLERLAVGPVLHWQGFEDNHNHFTLGHGGYFSPQRALELGVGLDFRTPEGRSWLLEGQAGLGYRRQEEAASPLLPLAPDGRRYPAEENQGLTFYGRLRGVRQLDGHWQLGAGLYHARGPDYGETGAALTLRYTFGARRGVFSTELPDL